MSSGVSAPVSPSTRYEARRPDAVPAANRKAPLESRPKAVNKAVHYNEWANFGKKDFEPVVAAFKALLACFRCEPCDLMPRVNPESVRCDCNTIGLNLKPKPK